MKGLFLRVFIFTVIPITLSAQISADDERVTFEEEFKTSFSTKPKLDVKFDNRFSFIRDNALKTIGIKVGLNFRRKFKVGLGLNQLLVTTERLVPLADNSIVKADLEYSYFSPYIEYVYYNSKKWEFSLALQVGLGGASYQYQNAEGRKVKLIESTVLSYEPATLIDYKIIRWIGIGTGVGYRFVYKSPGVSERFSSPEYVIKLKIYLGEIVRTITGKELEID